MAQCVSVVVPVYYNEDNIAPTWSALSAALAELPGDLTFEVIFVDDGSGDASYARLEALHRSEPGHVRVVKLTRNFGQVPAILAGLAHARGDCCVVMSADLQDPPELILDMVDRWKRGQRKIVLATRTQREDGLITRMASRTFYRLMKRFAIPQMPEGGFDFFLLDRQVIDIVNQVEEKNTFIQGHVLWTGFEPDIIEYTRRRREIGSSRWTLSKKLKYFVDGFVTYSLMPMRLITLTGVAVSALSFAYALVILILKLGWEIPLEGWTPTMIVILLLGGTQLIMLGIIGECIWRSYNETRKLPNFVVETRLDGDADG